MNPSVLIVQDGSNSPDWSQMVSIGPKFSQTAQLDLKVGDKDKQAKSKTDISTPQSCLSGKNRPNGLNNLWSIFKINPRTRPLKVGHFSTTDQKKIFFCLLTR